MDFLKDPKNVHFLVWFHFEDIFGLKNNYLNSFYDIFKVIMNITSYEVNCIDNLQKFLVQILYKYS